MNAILLLKLFLVPSLIYGVTRAGRRWGPAVAGWLSAFPIVSGPVLLAISLEQGAPFAAKAAEGTLMAVLAVIVYSLAYAWASGRFGVAGSLAAALGAWGVTVAGLQAVHPPVSVAVVVVVAALLVAPRLFPEPVNRGQAQGPGPDTRQAQCQALGPGTGLPVQQKSDLPWRMLAGATVVLTVSALAQGLGPRLSGFLAMFPVMGTVLVGFSHAYSGRAFAVQLLRGTMLGYFAFAAFCFAVSQLLRAQPLAPAFFAAFVFALTIQLLAKYASTKRQAT